MLKTICSSFIFLSLIFLSGCGFEPMAGTVSKSAYGNQLGAELASVNIEATANLSDQRLLAEQFRTRLEDLINPGELLGVEKLYTLRVNLIPTITPGFIAPDGKAQRFLVRMVSNYQLIRIHDNKMIEQGSLTRNSSYSNLPNSYFSTYIAEQDTMKRLSEALAEEYRMKLASLISNPPDKPSAIVEQRPIDYSTQPGSTLIVPGRVQ